MPSRAELEAMLSGQFDASIQAIPPASGDPDPARDPLYFHRLALFHEDMHGEAFCWMRAALGSPAPQGISAPRVFTSKPLAMRGADVRIGYGGTTRRTGHRTLACGGRSQVAATRNAGGALLERIGKCVGSIDGCR